MAAASPNLDTSMSPLPEEPALPSPKTTAARDGEPWFRRGWWYYDDVAVVVPASDFMSLDEASRLLRWTISVPTRLGLGELRPAVLDVPGGPFGVTRRSAEEAAQRWAHASHGQRLVWRLKAVIEFL